MLPYIMIYSRNDYITCDLYNYSTWEAVRLFDSTITAHVHTLTHTHAHTHIHTPTYTQPHTYIYTHSHKHIRSELIH